MKVPENSVCSEAMEKVYGPRRKHYGHPRKNFAITAELLSGVLHAKLAPGKRIDMDDVWRILVCVKLARDVHDPVRDNRVDIAGYAETGELLREEDVCE